MTCSDDLVLFIVVIVGGAVGVAVVDALFGVCSEEEEEEMAGPAAAVAGPAAAVAAVAVELDPRFVVQEDGFIQENPFADFSPDDPREFSGGKHKRRYTKRQQKNTRTKKNKTNKKMTKRKKTNKKKYKYV